MLTAHMLKLIVAMNLVAPLVAYAWRGFFMPPGKLAGWLGPVALLQVVLLWGWHLPAGLTYATHNSAGLVAMHTSLLAVSILFWAGVMQAARERVWGALSALLVTAKLACLLGVLLVFAPRALHTGFLEAMGVPADAAALDDQQLAGLLMLVAYTLGYIGPAVAIMARWLFDGERVPDWRDGST